MQLKAKRQAAQEQEASDFMKSLSVREAELRKLEQAHQAAIKAHNAKLKYAADLQHELKQAYELSSMLHKCLCLHRGLTGFKTENIADAATGHCTVFVITVASGERLQSTCSLYALLCEPQLRWAMVVTW